MTSGRILLFLGCGALAVGMTAGLFFLDQKRLQSESVSRSLDLARLTTHLIDPNDPAASLSRVKAFVDSKGIRIVVLKFPEDWNKGEAYSFDSQAMQLDYARILNPKDRTGVRIQINIDKRGFLGIEKKTHATMAMIFSVLLFGGALLGMLWRLPKRRITDPLSRDQILSWIERSKSVLGDLGIHIRDLVKSTRTLLGACSKSGKALGNFRKSSKSQLDQVAKLSDSIRELNATLDGLEGELLEALVSGGSPDSIRKRIVRATEVVSELSGGFEIFYDSLHPWMQELEEAYRSHQNIFNVSDEMSTTLRQTTEQLWKQVQHFRQIR